MGAMAVVVRRHVFGNGKSMAADSGRHGTPAVIED